MLVGGKPFLRESRASGHLKMLLIVLLLRQGMANHFPTTQGTLKGHAHTYAAFWTSTSYQNYTLGRENSSDEAFHLGLGARRSSR